MATGEIRRAAVQPCERPRQHLVPRQRVREPARPRDRRRRRRDQDDRARQADDDAEHVHEPGRQPGVEGDRDPHERGAPPLLAERRRAVLDRVRGEADQGEQRRDDDDDAQAREQPAGQRLAGLPRLGRVVGDRLETRVGQHRERECERQLAPARRRADLEALAREHEHPAEHDQEYVRRQRDPRDDDRDAVHLRAPHEPARREPEDHEHADQCVPGPPREAAPADRGADVVRREQAGERDDDQVVEEQHPAGDEAERVVERAPDERGCAAGLRDRGRSLRVRRGDDEEEGADDQQDDRCQPERVERDDAEREVQRGPDLAVGHRRERGRPEGALQAQLPRHQTDLLAM